MTDKKILPADDMRMISHEYIEDIYFRIYSSLENYYCCLTDDTSSTKEEFDALDGAYDALKEMRNMIEYSERARASLVCALKNMK